MIQFNSFLQMVFCMMFAILAFICFIGGFYNSVHFLLSAMSAIMCITIYKYW